MNLPDLNCLSLPLNLAGGKVYLLRNFREQDVDAVFNIESSISLTPWSKRNFLDSVHASHVCVCIEVDTQIIAYAVLSLTAGQGELLLLGVDANWQQKGVASLLLEQIDQFVVGRVQELFLEVRISNIPAINLYEKAGYHQLGERRNYYPVYGQPGLYEDALIYGKHFLTEN